MKREKAENLIRLISLLSTRKLKVGELAKLLNVQTKQIRRYYQVLDDLNLHVDEDLDGRSFIFSADKIQKALLEQEEKNWIYSIIKLHAPNHPFSTSIGHKLQQNACPLPQPEQLSDLRIADIFEKITRAIKQRTRIILLDYHSPSGTKTVSNRLVEPLEFLDDHRQLKAYEIASRKVKSFKIDRIGKVQRTEEPCTKNHNSISQTDPFGFSSTKFSLIELQLSPLAKDLLYENHPLARPYLVQNEKKYHYYSGPISNPIGVGRFILGLPGHVKVLKGEHLKEYLRLEIQKYDF
jgi:predicted DNA-binding transcriptional regulator YafY